MAKIKRFGVLKVAGFLGIYSAFVGLILGILFSLLSFVLPPTYSSLFGFSSFLSIILLPLLYGIVGFLSGLIFTPIMNLTLKIIKGIDLDMVLGGHHY